MTYPRKPLARRGTGRRRALWSLFDQALSSLTNFGLAIVVARITSTTQLGAFELAFSLYLFALGCSRALSTEPLLVRYSDTSEAEIRGAAGQAVGTAFVIGLGAGAVAFAVAVAVGGEVTAPVAAMAVVLPGLLAQDAWRYVFFAAGRPAKALGNDIVWGVAQAGLVIWLLLGTRPAVSSLILAWGASAAFAAGVGIVQAGVRPNPAAIGTWLRQHRDLAPRFVGEFTVGQGASQVAIWLVSIVGGLAVLGALRAALVLISPVRIFLTAAPAAAIPELIRIRRRSHAEFQRLVTRMSAGLAALVAVWTFAVMALPDSAGEAVLGDNWEAGRRLFPVLAFGWVALGFGTGAMVALRVLADARRSLRARLIISPLVVVVPPVSVIVGEAMGAAVGLTVVACWTAAVWWFIYRDASRAFGASPDAAPRYPDPVALPVEEHPIGGLAE